MRKSRYILVLLLLLSGILPAQNREIHFEQGSLSEALTKARASGKLLFFDAYTSWCGPCKKMAKEVFTLDQVADYFNAGFVCLKMDTELGEGPDIVKKFGINAYPTFLVLDGEGHELFRSVGASGGNEFVQKIKEGIAPENSLLTLEQKFNAGERESAFIERYCSTLSKARKSERLYEVVDLYFKDKSTAEICETENWTIYNRYVQDINTPLYHRIIDHIGEFKTLIGAEVIEKKLADAYSQIVFSSIPNRSLPPAVLEQYAEDVRKMGLQNKEELFYLESYLGLANLKATKRYDEILDFCEAGPVGYTSERTSTLMMCLIFLADGTKEQRERGMRLVYREAAKKQQAGKLSPDLEQLFGYIIYKLRGEEPAEKRSAADSSGVSFPVRYQHELKRLNELYPLNLQQVDSAVWTIRQKNSALVEFIRSAGLPADSVLLLEAETMVNTYSSLLGLENLMCWIAGKDTILPASYYSFVQEVNLDLPVWQNVKGMNRFLASLFAAMERNGYLQSGLADYLKKRAEKIGNPVVCENYLIYALQEEMMGYHQHLPEIIATVEPFVKSKENQAVLEEIRRKHQAMAVGYAHLNAGEKAADLAGKDKTGNACSLKNYAGKVVVIDVWSTNCMPCIAEMSYLRQLEKKFENEEVVFISYSIDRHADQWKKFIEKKNWEGIQLVDTGGPQSAFVQHYAIHSTPRLILIGRDGKIADSWGSKPSSPLLGLEIENLLKNN